MQSNVVIVPTFSVNSSSIIDDFIDKINHQTISHLDIVVVNNNEFELHITKKNHKGKLYVINPGNNMGSAGGFYLGMKYAHEVIKHYEFMILADDDAIIIEDNGLETLIQHADSNTITIPFWANLSADSKEDIHTSISCYGVIHKKIVSRLGYYSPLFFYGGEDGAYGIEIRSNNIAIEAVKKVSFMHPYKTFFSSSRGSSGLSTFRFNSILQNIYNIYYHFSLKSFLLIGLYIGSLFYMLFLNSYFRRRILTNIRNLLCYIPPIFGYANTNPVYDKDDDEAFSVLHIDSDVYDSFFVTCPYRTLFGTVLKKNAKTLIVDSRFSITTPKEFLKLLHGLIFSYKSVEFLHTYNAPKQEFVTKPILRFSSLMQKYLYIFFLVVLFPIAFVVSVVFYVIILVKYLLMFGIFQLKHNDLVKKIFDMAYVV